MLTYIFELRFKWVIINQYTCWPTYLNWDKVRIKEINSIWFLFEINDCSKETSVIIIFDSSPGKRKKK